MSAPKKPLTQRQRERIAWRGALLGIVGWTGESYETVAAKAGVPPYLKGELCRAPVLDPEKQATLCGEQATEERAVPTGHGDEQVELCFCAKHAAEIDAKELPGIASEPYDAGEDDADEDDDDDDEEGGAP